MKKIDALRQPLSKLSGLTGELAASNLDEAQRSTMTRASAELETLRNLVDELPKLPPGASPAGRSRRS